MAVTEQLQSNTVGKEIKTLLDHAAESEFPGNQEGELQPTSEAPTTLAVRVRTARNWLHKLGLEYSRVGKNVFFDGHERDDVVKYRQRVFVPTFLNLLKSAVKQDDEGREVVPAGVQEPLLFVTHDESVFNSNDGPRMTWMKKGEQPIRPKGRGKGLMVSDFLTTTGRLSANRGQGATEYATELLEFGGDKWWGTDDLLAQVRKAVDIFEDAHPGRKGVWLFDNATSHKAMAPDALIASKVGMRPGGAQPKMRDGWFFKNGAPIRQPMCFSSTHPQHANQPKGAKAILLERGVWRDGMTLSCKTKKNQGPGKESERTGCATDKTECCAQSVLAAQPDFQEQKSVIQELLESRGHFVLFYPKFHCECNWIERFWGGCKQITRENCTYSIAGLREHVPRALESVPGTTIYRYFLKSVRIIEAYADDIRYETTEFRDRVYRSHRRLEDKTRW